MDTTTAGDLSSRIPTATSRPTPLATSLRARAVAAASAWAKVKKLPSSATKHGLLGVAAACFWKAVGTSGACRYCGLQAPQHSSICSVAPQAVFSLQHRPTHEARLLGRMHRCHSQAGPLMATCAGETMIRVLHSAQVQHENMPASLRTPVSSQYRVRLLQHCCCTGQSPQHTAHLKFQFAITTLPTHPTKWFSGSTSVAPDVWRNCTRRIDRIEVGCQCCEGIWIWIWIVRI